jgi:hypothetical protein
MSRDEIKKLQEIIGTDVDGIWGPKSRAAYSAWLDKSSQPSEDTFVSPEDTINAGKTTSDNLGDEYNVAEELGETKLDPNYGRDPRAKSGFDPMDSFVAPQMDNLYDKSTRIAEIQRRLDEIKREKEKYDVEEKMGEYKFIYDADPSTYTTHQQNLRSNEQTNAIRKASEDATKASQAQTAWRQLLIDEETAKYEKMDAENQVRAAQQNGDAAAYRDAKVGLSRINAKMNRLAKDKDEYRNRFAEMLGLSKADLGEPAGGDWDEQNDVTYGKLNALQNLERDVENSMNDLRKRPDKMSDAQKRKIETTNRSKHAKYLDTYNKNKDVLGSTQQADWEKKLNSLEDAIPTFKKSQPTTMTQEKFAKLSPDQLVALGLNKLTYYKDVKKYKNDNLGWAISKAK